MPKETGRTGQRIPIPYFEGVNSTVQHAIARKTELAHMENARAPMIGVLEKREGQAVLGTNTEGEQFITLGNFGLFYFFEDQTEAGDDQGLFRVTTTNGTTASIYFLDDDDRWQQMADSDAQGLALSIMSAANADGKMILVNGGDQNRLIDTDGTTVLTGANPGSLFNSPVAHKVAFYKSRIYLADFLDPLSDIRYKTSVIRSSYPLGIISLVNGDTEEATGGNWVIGVTDSKYFYTDSGMNELEIYRGSQKVATITISSFTETDITASTGNVSFESGFTGFLSADEIWISGTFSGEKQYRWINNPTSIGRDVKQYDTFKLVGGDEDAITMLEPVGNILLIANRNTMLTWNDYNLENFDLGIGCVSKNGYVKLRGSIYFLHYSGIYQTTGTTPQLISRKIERYIKGATKEGLENGGAGYKGLSVFFTIGDVALYNNDGSFWKTLPQVCVEFNVADQNFYIHTNVTAEQFETFISPSGAERVAITSFTEARDAVLGEELIVNGTFDGNTDGWTLGDGWSYGNHTVIFG